MTITIYSQPSCVQCPATYKALDKLGLDYEVKRYEREPSMQAPASLKAPDLRRGVPPSTPTKLGQKPFTQE